MANMKRRVSDALELPREVLMNLPFVTITGKEEVCIENYKGVVEYGSEKIRIHTTAGLLKIEGKNLLLKHITSENVIITGVVLKLEFPE